MVMPGMTPGGTRYPTRTAPSMDRLPIAGGTRHVCRAKWHFARVRLHYLPDTRLDAPDARRTRWSGSPTVIPCISRRDLVSRVIDGRRGPDVAVQRAIPRSRDPCGVERDRGGPYESPRPAHEIHCAWRPGRRRHSTACRTRPIPPCCRWAASEYRVHFPDAGVYWYHPHVRERHAAESGIAGAIVVQTRWAGHGRRRTTWSQRADARRPSC